MHEHARDVARAVTRTPAFEQSRSRPKASEGLARATCGERHIRLLAPLAFLSPRIIAAIADGTDIAGNEGKKRHRLCQKFLAKTPPMPASKRVIKWDRPQRRRRDHLDESTDTSHEKSAIGIRKRIIPEQHCSLGRRAHIGKGI
jgi:hypothetical protein